MSIYLRRSIDLVFFGVLAVVSLYFCSALNRWMERKMNQPEYIYAASDVLQVCAALYIPADDSFCVDPTDQGPVEIERMLERQFPRGKATYDELMPLLEGVQTGYIGVSGCLRDFQKERQFDTCPPPHICEGAYTCSFDFPETIMGVWVTFGHGTGQVKDYMAVRPSSTS